ARASPHAGAGGGGVVRAAPGRSGGDLLGGAARATRPARPVRPVRRVRPLLRAGGAGPRRLLRRDAPRPANLGGDAAQPARAARAGPAVARALRALGRFPRARRARLLL